jgi:hypothetical protein
VCQAGAGDTFINGNGRFVIGNGIAWQDFNNSTQVLQL